MLHICDEEVTLYMCTNFGENMNSPPSDLDFTFILYLSLTDSECVARPVAPVFLDLHLRNFAGVIRR